VNSRAKGVAGELEACRFMEGYTTLKWERTAQRWGNATPDIWAPAKPNLGVHVEVKWYADSLATPTRLALEHEVIQTGDDLYYCRLHNLRRVLVGGHPAHFHATVHNLVSGFMRQAERDMVGTAIPLVLMRQNRAEWLAVWRYHDDDLMRNRLEPYLKVVDAE
jgi:hypothetical protein